MLPLIDQLKTAMAGLPSADRAELAHYLLLSLDESTDNSTDDEALTAWHHELTLRVEEVRSGKVIGIPLEQVVAELRERFP